MALAFSPELPAYWYLGPLDHRHCYPALGGRPASILDHASVFGWQGTVFASHRPLRPAAPQGGRRITLTDNKRPLFSWPHGRR